MQQSTGASPERHALAPEAFAPPRYLRAASKVLPEHARAHNRALVLQTLYQQGQMSRADLARATGLTRVTVSDLIAEVIAEGIVVELGVREVRGPGKPATLIDIDRQGHQIIGIDLSDESDFHGAVLDLDGAVVHRASIARPPVGAGEENLAAVHSIARDLCAQASQRLLGVGIGTPGVVRPDGYVLSSPNLGWSDVPLERDLREALGLPVLVRNDANAAVLAEYTFGAGSADLLLVRVGRGVGAGLITGNHPITGAHYAAGEIGHVRVGTDEGPECVCGRFGCLEAWLNVPRLLSTVAETAQRESVLRDAGTRLGIACAPIIGAINPQELVLSGPPELLSGVLSTAVRECLSERTLRGISDDIVVRMTSVDEIVIRGAAVMVLSAEWGVS